MSDNIVVGVLRALLQLDTAQFVEGTRKSAKAADDMGKEIAASGKRVGDTLTAITAGFTTVGASSKKFDTDLARLGSQFSGVAIAREATLISKAVENAGGAAVLTRDEMKRVNSVMNEAIAKFKSLGEVAPKAFLDLEQATRKVEPQLTLLQKHALSFGAAIGSFAGALGANAFQAFAQGAVDAVSNGAKLTALSGSFDRLTSSIGESGEAMLDLSRSATRGLVSDLDLIQSANKAILLGLPVTAASMADLAKTAMVLGRAMGQDATKSLDDLITALGRSSPLILDNLGLTVKLGEANEAFAAKHNKTVDQLTEGERKLAFYEAALAAAEKKTQELGDAQLGVIDQLGRLGTALGNRINQTSAAANESSLLAKAIGFIADQAEEATQSSRDFAQAEKELGEEANAATVYMRAQAIEMERLLKLTEDIKLTPATGLGALQRPTITGLTADYAMRLMDEADRKTKAAAESAKKLNEERIRGERAFADAVVRSTNQVVAERNRAGELVFDQLARTYESNRDVNDSIAAGAIEWTRWGESAQQAIDDTLKRAQQVDMRGLMTPWVSNPQNQRVSENLPDDTVENLQKRLRDVDTILSGINNKWAEMAVVAARTVDTIFKRLEEGDPVGAIVAGVTGGISALVGIFSDREEMQVNDMRDAYIEAAGGLHELNVKAQEAGTNLHALLQADSVEEYNRAIKDLEKSFGRMEAATDFLESTLPGALRTVTEQGALMTREFMGVVKQIDEMGASAAAISEFVIAQIKGAVSGISGFLLTGSNAYDALGEKSKELATLEAEYADKVRRGFSETSDEMDDLRERIQNLTKEVATQLAIVDATAVTSAQAAEAFAASLVGAFGELQARGMSVTDALKEIAPGVDALQLQLEKAGITGGAAFDYLRSLVGLAADEVAGPALNAVSQLQGAFVGLHNSGLLTQDIFAGLASQVSDTFAVLVAQGVDGEKAMRLMQPTLQRIWELQKDFGYEVDESTQEMLTQAEEAGLVGDAHRDAQDVAVKAMQEAAKAMKDVADILKRIFGIAGDEAETFGQRVTDAVEDIPTNVDIRVRYHIEGRPDGAPTPTFPTVPGVDVDPTGGNYDFGVSGLMAADAPGVPESAFAGGASVSVTQDNAAVLASVERLAYVIERRNTSNARMFAGEVAVRAGQGATFTAP